MQYFRKVTTTALLCFLIAPIAAAQQPLQQIEPVITNRISAGPLVGISVGYIHSNGKDSYLSRGVTSLSTWKAVDQHTFFEIGSVTKLFTSLAIASLVQEKKISLDSEAESLLPDGYNLPSYNDNKITVKHLVTHTSGLPRVPSNLPMTDPARPYAGYSESDLKSFLSNYELSRAPGAQFAYSNIGMALAGYILEKETGLSYGQVVKRYILDPLKMTSTTTKLSTKDSNRLAVGHRGGAEVPGWDLTVFEGAGALYSTTSDMVKFLKGQMSAVPEIKSSVKLMQQPLFDIRKNIGPMQDKVGMGGFYATKGDTLFWHNGATGGYKSFVGLNIEKGKGVVILSNSSSSIIDLGLNLLDPEGYPLKKTVSLTTRKVQQLVGEYQTAMGAKFTISRNKKQLYVQLTGQNKYPIYPKSETRFYLKAVPAEIEFIMTDDRATKLILHQNGRKVPASRMVE